MHVSITHPLTKKNLLCYNIDTCLGPANCILLLHALVDKLSLFIIMVAKYTELRYNNYCIVGLSKMLLLVIVWSNLVGAQSNGDVRIIQNTNDAFIKDWPWGRLEVYLDGEWGTFCANGPYPGFGFDSYAADAACRQLGYQYSLSDEVSKASDYTDVIPLASNSTPIHIGFRKLDCDKTTDGGFLHVLRCFDLSVDHDIDSTCTHDDDVIIECSTFDLDWLWEGYDTELFLNSEALNSTYRSSGVLEILYSSQSGAASWGWSNVCGTKFDQNAANTACIQLGYTGALSYYVTSANRSRERLYTGIWLDGVTCGENVYSCLDSCFCYPRTLTAVPCNLDNVIALTCTFDLAKRDAVHPGSRDLCEERQKTYCAHPNTPSPSPELIVPKTNINFIIVSAVLSTVIVLLSLVVVGLIVMIWNSRGRAQYQTIN